MPDKRVSSIIVLLIVLTCVRGILYAVLIPFGEAPDESYHFRLIKAKQVELGQFSRAERQRVAAQLEWSIYYILNPDAKATKRSLESYAGARLLKPPSSWQIYYWLMGWILRILSLEQIHDEVYVIRGISVLCGTFVVAIAYWVTRELFPDDPFLLIGVPALITFIPQFAAMNGVVNNDKLTEVCCAAIFWVVIKIFQDQALLTKYAVAYLALMGIALLGKRTAVFMIPFFPISLLVYYWKGGVRWQLHLLIVGILFGMIVGMFGIMEWVTSANSFLKEYIVSVPVRKVLAALWRQWHSQEFLLYCLKFFVVLYWSFWAVFGHMTVRLHYIWYLLAIGAHGLAGLGLLKYSWRIRTRHITIAHWKTKILYLCALSILLVLVIIFLRSVIFQPGHPFLEQGRRLFLVIIPISLLTVLGMKYLFRPAAHRVVGALGLFALVLLDTVCLSQYILLNFQARALF